MALRFGNVYGPRSSHKSSVVARFLQRAVQGRPLEVYGDGGQTRDFIYIDDLTAAIRLAAEAKDLGGEVFQIATNQETTVNELVQTIRRTLQEHGVPVPAVEHQTARVGDAAHNFSDISKATRLLGWSPQVDLPEGLRRTLVWYQSQQEAARAPPEPFMKATTPAVLNSVASSAHATASPAGPSANAVAWSAQLRRRLASNVAWSMIAELLGRGSVLIGNLFIAHALQVAVFGVLTSARRWPPASGAPWISA